MKRTTLSTLFIFLLLAGLAHQVAYAALFAGPAPTGPDPFENGDFESGTLEPWIHCGGVQLVDAQAVGTTPLMVHHGRYAARLGQPIDTSCGNGALGPNQVLAEDITIPSEADDVTISFWYSAIGDWAAGEIVLELTQKPTAYLGSVVFVDAIKTDELTPGWHLFRQNVKLEDIVKLRGQTLYLSIYVRFQGQPEWNWGIFFDEIRVAPTRERTLESPLPADLIGDGSRPIVLSGPGVAANSYGVYRIDTDGGNRWQIASSTLPPHIPTWSPDGRKIVYQTDWLEPEVNLDPNKFQALIGRAYLMDADGGNLRPLFTTSGLPGTKESPLGCLRTDTCADKGSDALDMLLSNLHWSPNGQQIMTTICVRNRWYNGDKAAQDAACHLSNYTLQGGTNLPVVGLVKYLDEAQGASWAANGKALFISTPSFGNRQKGVWEVNTAAQPPQAELLMSWLTEAGSSPDLRANPYSDPTWAPDGRHFVTYRLAASVHYMPSTSGLGDLLSNYEILLHDRQNLSSPRMLLLVDQGTLAGRPAWSPDGKYLLYTLYYDGDTHADIWWLEVATGKTGRVTHDGVSFQADWRPQAGAVLQRQQAVNSNLNDTSMIANTIDGATNKSAGQTVFLPLVQRSSPQVQPTASPTPRPTATGKSTPTPIVFSTITPTVAATPIPTIANPTLVPPRGISGQVRYQGVGIGGIKLQLEECVPGLQCAAKMTTTTDGNGYYAFLIPSSTFGYQVTYRNGAAGGNAEDERFLGYWQSFPILGSDYAERVRGGVFEIANIELLSPDDGAVVGLPTTFEWKSRGIAGDKYRWHIQTYIEDVCSQESADTNTSFTFASRSCIFPEISSNTPIPWWVEVTQEGANSGMGSSWVPNVIFGE